MKENLKTLLLKISTYPMDPFVYEVADGAKTLSLDNVFLAAVKRAGVDVIENKFNEMVESSTKDKDFLSTLNLTPEESVGKDMFYLLRDLGAYLAYERHFDFTLKEVAENHSVSEEFVSWFSSKKGLKKNQILCDHDFQDQHSDDGYFYNSVSRCKKCLMDSENNLSDYEDLDLLWEAWCRNEKK